MFSNKQNQGMVENRPAQTNGAAAGAPNQNVSQVCSRRVLGDIGNIVGDFNGRCNLTKQGLNGKPPPIPNITRPITTFVDLCFTSVWSFGAQLLLNPQLAVNKGFYVTDKQCQREVVNREKKTIKIQNLPPTNLSATEDAQDLVIVEPAHKVMATYNNNIQAAIRKVKAPIPTATITSQIEASYGEFDAEVSNANDLMPNIDEGDIDNQLAVAEYVEDIYKSYRKNERMSRVQNYMTSQSEINEKKRAILVDWLIEVHLQFQLMPETLYLTINLLDRYLCTASVSKRNFQLVGLTAMLLASKYEEIRPASVDDFLSISDNSYTREQILAMEKSMLNKLKFHLSVPTPYVFLVRFLKAADSDKEMENLAFFLTELSLVQYVMTKFAPSLFAAAAVYTSRCTLKKEPIWNDLLKHHTGYSEADLMECVMLMVKYHTAENKSKGVQNKYSAPEFDSVALLTPAKLPSKT